jgi:putative membrane protein
MIFCYAQGSLMPNWKILVLILLYFVGLIGLQSDWAESFKALSALQLVVSSCLVLTSIQKFTKSFVVRFALIMFLCFIIEVVGVLTTYPFGAYYYGSNLGLKVLGVPLVIALNWALLIYSAKVFFLKYFTNKYLTAFLSATLLTTLDFMIERLAGDLGYWYWLSESIPVQNYVSWFCIAFFCSLMLKEEDCKSNLLATVNLILIVIFFLLLNLF